MHDNEVFGTHEPVAETDWADAQEITVRPAPGVATPMLVPAVRVDQPAALLFSKAPVVRRAAADLIDRLVPLPFIAHFFWPWAVVCVAYDLLCDGTGASVGKRLMGLQAVVVSSGPTRAGQPCSLGRSVLRNVLWSGARLCYTTVLLAPLGLAYDLVEVLLVLCSPNGRRLGDLLAGTQVIASSQTGQEAIR